MQASACADFDCAEGSCWPASVTAGKPRCLLPVLAYKSAFDLSVWVPAEECAALKCISEVCVSLSSTTALVKVFLVDMCSEQPKSQAAIGAWLLMTGVAEQDPAAPSWKFLQVSSCCRLQIGKLMGRKPYAESCLRAAG